MKEYSEHEKLHEIKDQSQTISEFFDWLGSKGLLICKYHKQVGSTLGQGEFQEAGYYPETPSIQILLTDFFDIDQKKLEEEKKDMLDDFRNESLNKPDKSLQSFDEPRDGSNEFKE